MAAGLAAVAFAFMAAAVGFAYRTRGNAPLIAAALGFCSILMSVSSFAYGIFSFFEKEKNYLLAKISLVAAGMLILIWLFMIIIAL